MPARPDAWADEAPVAVGLFIARKNGAQIPDHISLVTTVATTTVIGVSVTLLGPQTIRDLKNVQLVPYTWRHEVTIVKRELAQAHAFLALEERRARPRQAPIAHAGDFKRHNRLCCRFPRGTPTERLRCPDPECRGQTRHIPEGMVHP